MSYALSGMPSGTTRGPLASCSSQGGIGGVLLGGVALATAVAEGVGSAVGNVTVSTGPSVAGGVFEQ